MPHEAMLILGTYVFAVDAAAYQRLSRTKAWRWASLERAGGPVVRQYVGMGDDRVSLEGMIYPTYLLKPTSTPATNGLGQVAAMRAEADKATPLLMIDQLGYLRGRWVIERIAETQSIFLPGGIPKKIEFTIELSAYGDANG